jgi:hypothetical protein
MRKLVNEVLNKLHPEIPYSKKAEDLVCGTIAQESDYGLYRKQIGVGPALGICQIEKATFEDIKKNFLKYHKNIEAKICMVSHVSSLVFEDMLSNDALSICMARVAYFRQKEGIPETLEEQAAYYKKYYNTPLGKATVQEYIEKYKKYVLCEKPN